MTVSEVKSNLLDAMDAMDKSRMNVYDLKMYADVLRTVADISDKTYADCIADLTAKMPLGLWGGAANDDVQDNL